LKLIAAHSSPRLWQAERKSTRDSTPNARRNLPPSESKESNKRKRPRSVRLNVKKMKKRPLRSARNRPALPPRFAKPVTRKSANNARRMPWLTKPPALLKALGDALVLLLRANTDLLHPETLNLRSFLLRLRVSAFVSTDPKIRAGDESARPILLLPPLRSLSNLVSVLSATKDLNVRPEKNFVPMPLERTSGAVTMLPEKTSGVLTEMIDLLATPLEMTDLLAMPPEMTDLLAMPPEKISGAVTNPERTSGAQTEMPLVLMLPEKIVLLAMPQERTSGAVTMLLEKTSGAQTEMLLVLMLPEKIVLLVMLFPETTDLLVMLQERTSGAVTMLLEKTSGAQTEMLLAPMPLAPMLLAPTLVEALVHLVRRAGETIVPLVTLLPETTDPLATPTDPLMPPLRSLAVMMAGRPLVLRKRSKRCSRSLFAPMVLLLVCS
jgi:F0F1-type ATP synthase membrane subunit c/vacuolar-type H+-ATPase subunit K